jgi:hypothetical protein
MSPLPLVITSHSSKVRFPIRHSNSGGVSQGVNCLPLELLKEYRKLDDTVTMRINRTTAQFRDRDRMGASGKGSIQEQACSHLWRELVGTYCFTLVTWVFRLSLT